MYMRFVTGRIDSDSRRPQGVFAAAYELLGSGDLDREQWLQVRELLDWFSEHLPTPPKEFPAGRAIFWFRAGRPKAKPCIARMWDLVHVLREQGHVVEVYSCRHLGNIYYRDDFQVAAYPSPLDSRITVR